MVNIEMLRENADMETVCDNLKIPTLEKGGRIQVICPFHDDHNFGSAYIINNQIRCFACDVHADALSVVMKVKGYNFPQACECLANMFGGVAAYTDSEAAKKTFMPLNKKEREALMLPSTQISINNIAQSDRELYKRTILNLAEKAKDKYQSMLEQYGRRDAPQAVYFYKLLGGASKEQYAEFSAIMKDRISTCEDIIRKFTTTK